MYYIKVDLKHGLERPVYYAVCKPSPGLYHFTVLGLLDDVQQQQPWGQCWKLWEALH